MFQAMPKCVSTLCSLILIAWLATGCSSMGVDRPGAQRNGAILLPNNWSLTPAGHQIPVGDLPLGMTLSPDGRYLLVTNNGYADQYVSVIDTVTLAEVDKIPMKESWLGLAFNGRGDRLYVSAGGLDEIEEYEFMDGKPSHRTTLSLKSEEDETPWFAAGLALTPDDSTLLACAMRKNKLALYELDARAEPAYVDVGAYPYTVVVHPSGETAYVSNWGGSSVSVVDLVSKVEATKIPVGDHPNALVLSPGGDTLYVASANSNELALIDTTNNSVRQVLDLSPYPGAPASGSTPNGIALSSDGSALYVVSADNNSVNVVDLSQETAQVRGLIPTGWYPTAVLLTPDNRTLYIANGKGLSSRPNPKGPQPYEHTESLQYIGLLFLGTVSVLPVPDARQLAAFTRQVRQNNGFSAMSRRLAEGRSTAAPRAIPRRLGEPSPIKYVFYILKENRTYDQVFGDIEKGEGDANLALFGRDVTPNHHAIANSFVLFDNFYTDAEVSMDGHSWSMGAIATDFVEKLWPTNYSNRHFPAPIYLPVAYPTAGFLWDAAQAVGLTYRSFGEFARSGEDGSYSPLPALEGHVSPAYPILDLTIRDETRADIFIEEFKEMVAKGEVPRLNILSLPSDHTMGTRPGAWTPRAMMADNDLALGRIVEAISTSPIWAESAIFVIQDDSQNGPDHIDAHRTVALAASPYIRRGYVDHTMYDTVSLLRTIELILGIPPMSQYDAAAVPLVKAFQDTPDLTPFEARAATWPLDERNTEESYGAAISARMNFTEMDAAPEALLNEIIWKSIRGADSVMPQPHTSRTTVRQDEDDDDDAWEVD